MNIAQLPASDTFRTQTSVAPTDRLSRDEGIIIGAKALQLGGLSPGDIRPWKVDRTTLEQLATLINAIPTGAKMRLGHPLSGSAPATLAKASNARIIDDGKRQVVAVDVKFTAASKRIQNGELRNQLFDLAEETPEDFGLSIDATPNRSAMKTRDSDGLIPIRLSALTAIDFVDDASATSGGLFSTEGKGNDMATVAEQIIELDTLKAEFSTLKTENEALKATNAELSAKVSPPVVENTEKVAAKVELSRRSEITALCTLAKVNDGDRDLFVTAGFSRAEAQDYLKSSGRLSVANPPISEGGTDLGDKKETPEQKFGVEYDTFESIYSRQGITRDQFIASRKKD